MPPMRPLTGAQSLLAALFCLACTTDEPVLSGVPSAPVEPAPAADAEARPRPEGAPLLLDEVQGYQKPEGVLVDVRHLGGKDYKDVRDIVSDQLGGLVEARELPGDNGRALVFERGELRVVDDRIIRVRVPLEPPLRRTAALAATGFPPATGRYVTLHREYRLNHEWGFRRIRMMRENRTSELVNAVDAWVRVPGEASPQR